MLWLLIANGQRFKVVWLLYHHSEAEYILPFLKYTLAIKSALKQPDGYSYFLL